MIFQITFALIQNVKTMVSEEKETSQPVLAMGRIKPIYYVVRVVIKGSPRIVIPSLCTPIIAEKPFSVLFWLLPNVTVSGGQQESFL